MSAQYGPHRWSAGYHDDGHNADFRGATFVVRDLSGARFVDCDFSRVKIVDAFLQDVDVSGYVGNLVINGVDVTAYVESELDRRHPERVQLRGLRSAEDFRAMWATIERLWAGAVARAERLPERLRLERVDGEWSFAETQRHLIYITDSWVRRTVLDDAAPFHRIGLPQTAYAPRDAAALGMVPDSEPTYEEVLQVRAERQSLVRKVMGSLTDAGLGRVCARAPAPGYPEEERPVAECLVVAMEEECEHYRFAMRDLAVLEARVGSGTDGAPASQP